MNNAGDGEAEYDVDGNQQREESPLGGLVAQLDDLCIAVML